MTTFNLGDKVQHKSGGPRMVVIGIESDKVLTRWSDVKSREFKTDTFISDELVTSNEPSVMVRSQVPRYNPYRR